MTPKQWLGLLLLIFVLDPRSSRAQTIPLDRIDPPRSTGRLEGDLNLGMIDGDGFATLNLGMNMSIDSFGLGIWAPLRMRLIDADPQNREIAHTLRKEDWDEFSDYLKIIRYIQYGSKGDTLYCRAGGLPGATLGHASLVGRYYNNVDLDHYKMGLVLDINTNYGGIESIFNNAFLSSLIGARMYVRPWSLISTQSYLNNLAVGLTLVTDHQAPFRLEPNGTDDGYPKVLEKKAATATGIDIEFQLFQTEWATLLPYMDFNHLTGAGSGLHVGIMSKIRIISLSLDLHTRLEYRYMQSDYIPAYFNSFYEIQKYGFPFRDVEGLFGPAGREVTDQPKRRAIEHIGGDILHGYWAQLIIGVHDLIQLGVSFDDYDGPYNSNLRIFLEIPTFSILQMGVFYYRHNYEGADQAFRFDHKSLFLAECRYQINPYFHLSAQYWRIWQMNPLNGRYQPVNDWSIGLGISYPFSL